MVAVLLSGGAVGHASTSAQAAVRAAGIVERVIWWTAAPPRWVSACWRSAARSWRSRAGRRAAIARELERVRGQSGMLLTVDRYDNLLRSGTGLPRQGVARRDARREADPVPGRETGGSCRSTGCGAGTSVVPRVLALLERRLTPRPQVVRFGVVHAEAPGDGGAGAERRWWRRTSPRDCFVSLATGVLGTHVGAGAWAVFYQVEDGTRRRTATPAEGRAHGANRPVAPGFPGAAPGWMRSRT